MPRTGIFFHYQQGERLADFPQALGDILSKSNVFFYDALYPTKPKSSYELEPVPQNLLYEVHSARMIEQIKLLPYYKTALYSAGGTVQAGEEICEDRIDNAFVFTGSGDHHAGRDSFGGWCYFNGAALAIWNLRQKYGVKRFAIVDTDAHHGDGTWDIFKNDGDTLYLCFCNMASTEYKNKINIEIPPFISDEDYLAEIKRELIPKIKVFKPEILFWNWGYDGTQGEYGDMGLSPDFHIQAANTINELAAEVCEGKLVVVLCGGQSRRIALYAIPRIIRILAGI